MKHDNEHQPSNALGSGGVSARKHLAAGNHESLRLPGEDSAPATDYDDPRRPLRRAMRLGGLALLGIALLSLAVWGGVAGLPGIFGVLIGAGIGGAFVLLTAASVLFTARTTATTTGAVVLGGWVLKMLVLIIVLVLIRDLDFYHHTAFGVTTIAVALVVLGAEAWAIITTRVTYVN